MTGHTPGPWAVNQVSTRVRANDGTPIAYLEGRTQEDDEANGRLIAAAPALLKAAKAAYQYAHFHVSDCEGLDTFHEGAIFDETKGCTCFLADLFDAIAKAEGREP